MKAIIKVRWPGRQAVGEIYGVGGRMMINTNTGICQSPEIFQWSRGWDFD